MDKYSKNRDTRNRQRRNHIMQAAISCFLKKGFHQSSIRDIAKQAEMSLGNFYNHFASKSELIVELASYEAIELAWVEKLSNSKNAKDSIQIFIKRYLNYVEQKENIILSVEVLAEAVRNPEVGEHYLNNRKILINSLVKILKTGVSSNEFSDIPDTNEVAELILDMIEGVGMRYVLSQKTSSRMTLKTLQKMILRLITK